MKTKVTPHPSNNDLPTRELVIAGGAVKVSIAVQTPLTDLWAATRMEAYLSSEWFKSAPAAHRPILEQKAETISVLLSITTRMQIEAASLPLQNLALWWDTYANTGDYAGEFEQAMRLLGGPIMELWVDAYKEGQRVITVGAERVPGTALTAAEKEQVADPDSPLA